MVACAPVGSADALVSIWDLASFTCVQTVSKLEWPARTIGFSADGQFLAAGSEDTFIDISEVRLTTTACKICMIHERFVPRDVPYSVRLRLAVKFIRLKGMRRPMRSHGIHGCRYWHMAAIGRTGTWTWVGVEVVVQRAS
eukprot:SAG31_NODE_3165_length_4601_cov_2.917814_3_plen_140_part_00